jgi:lysophospholipase L1-like esterase
MPSRQSSMLLLVALVASLVLNAIFALTARHYYIANKLRAVEPTYAERYTEQNPAVRPRQGRQLITLFGDSRIANWHPPPGTEGYDTVNRGVGGETTAQMRYRFRSDVLALQPQLVIMQAGINDLVAAGLAPDRESQVYRNTVTNISTMVAQAKSSGIRVVLLTIIPPATPGILRRLVWSERIAELVTEANRELLLLQSPPQVEVINTQSILQLASGAWKPDVILDTLHLAPAGYELLNRAVSSVIQRR